MDNEGAVQGNDYHAFRSNMKINATITDWLEVGANVNFQDRSDGDIQVSLGSNYWVIICCVILLTLPCIVKWWV